MEKNKKKYIKKNLYEKKTKKKLDRAGGGAGGERRRPCRRSAPPAAPRRRSRRIHIPRRRIRPRRPRICRPPPAPQLRAATTGAAASGRAKEAGRDRGGRARHCCRRVWREPWPARRWREQGPRRGLRCLRASGEEERKGSRRTALDPAMGKDERRRRWGKRR